MGRAGVNYETPLGTVTITIEQPSRFGVPFRTVVESRFVPPFTREAPESIHALGHVDWDSMHCIYKPERESAELLV